MRLGRLPPHLAFLPSRDPRPRRLAPSVQIQVSPGGRHQPRASSRDEVGLAGSRPRGQGRPASAPFGKGHHHRRAVRRYVDQVGLVRFHRV